MSAITADRLQHRALMHLTLRVFGETHRIFAGFQAYLTGLVRSETDDDGSASGARLMSAMGQVENRWRQTVQQWLQLFEAAREQAASLPFGALHAKHNHYMGAVQRSLQEDLTPQEMDTVAHLWHQRRQAALQATAERIHGDGLRLSNRIWRLENGGWNQIRSTLATAFASRTSASDLARRLEHLLGADQDLPRWAEERLYSMDARQRLRSRGGLLRGTEHRATGLAYNALRLARTELQYANHAVTTQIAAASPWVTGRYVRLSASHPKADICDELAAGGPYPVTDDLLPAHANCMCWYKEALMPVTDFARQVRGWLNGENQFLDTYRGWLGMNRPVEPLPAQLPLVDLLEAWLTLGVSDHARLLRLV